MIKNNKIISSIVFILFIVLLSACSSNSTVNEKESNEENDNQENNNETENIDNNIEKKEFSDEETTIKVAAVWDEGYFDERIGDYVRDKLPHLTIEHVNWDGTKENLEELYAEEIVPDVFLASSGQRPLEELDSVYALDDMIESYDVDLSHIQDVALEGIRSRDEERRLVGIPQETSVVGLYYNEEIFDLFGESYPDPEESMTWDELMGLADKLTGERNGTNYCGLEMEDLEDVPLRQLSLNKTDPETGDVLIQSEPEFAEYAKLMEKYYDLDVHEDDCSFFGKTTAMAIGWQGVFTWEEPEYMKKMDVAPLPDWEELTGVGIMSDGHPWAINKHSEHKDAALQFILEGVSEEYQMILSRSGTPVPSNLTGPNEEFGIETEGMEGKNVSAFFANDPAPPPEQISVWDEYVEFDFEELAESSDVIEFLRQTKEASEIKVQESMSNK